MFVWLLTPKGLALSPPKCNCYYHATVSPDLARKNAKKDDRA